VENPLFFSFFVKTALFWVFLLKKKKSKVELARFKSSLAVWALVRVKSYNHEKSRFLLLFQVFLKPKKISKVGLARINSPPMTRVLIQTRGSYNYDIFFPASCVCYFTSKTWPVSCRCQNSHPFSYCTSTDPLWPHKTYFEVRSSGSSMAFQPHVNPEMNMQ
jgi:hypothetical protein